jgi:hypothetical protein
MKKLALAMAAFAASAMTATPAQAALVLVDHFDGNDCGQGIPFDNCWATQGGVVLGPVEDGSPSVYKLEAGGGEESNDLYGSIDGSEFDVTLLNNLLSFTYTPGLDDPSLHYVSVKQANDGYLLYYDENPITSGSIDLTQFDPVGWSHITFYNSGTPGVPEPATWAMLLIGFGAVGATMRSKKKADTGRRLRLA